MTAQPSARLRGHHFICLQFFRGEGYSAPFVENLTVIIEGAARSEALLVEGADDVCASCPGLAADGTCLDPNAGEVEVRRLDRLAWATLGVRPGERLSLAEARERLLTNASEAARWRREACEGCTWQDICDFGWDALDGRTE